MPLSEDIRFKVEQAAGPMSFGQLQTFATLIKSARENKVTISEILKYVEEEQNRRIAAIESVRNRKKEHIKLFKERAPRCPKCKGLIVLAAINYPNEKKYRSRWYCRSGFEKDHPDGLCGYEKLNIESIPEILESLGIKYTE